MRRAIYEDDVIKLLDKGWKLGVYPVASNIHALPSAQTEIILCKDCKHYLHPLGCGHIDGMVTSHEDGFCSYAERREE